MLSLLTDDDLLDLIVTSKAHKNPCCTMNVAAHHTCVCVRTPLGLWHGLVFIDVYKMFLFLPHNIGYPLSSSMILIVMKMHCRLRYNGLIGHFLILRFSKCAVGPAVLLVMACMCG